MESKNNMLIGLALLERTEPQLKTDKREQLTRANLEMIKQNISKALELFVAAGIESIYINGYLLSVVECIDSVLSDSNFVQTDLELKDIITRNVLESMDDLYLAVGKYYMENDFDYSFKLKPILTRIVDKCISRGYYFGYVPET